MHINAVLRSIAQHHQVKLTAHHLPCPRTLLRLVVGKIKWLREAAFFVDKLHAVLLDKTAVSHLLQHAESLKHPERLGDEGLTNMKSGKSFAFEQGDLTPLLRNERCGCRPGRTTTNHHNFCVGRQIGSNNARIGGRGDGHDSSDPKKESAGEPIFLDPVLVLAKKTVCWGKQTNCRM